VKPVAKNKNHDPLLCKSCRVRRAVVNEKCHKCLSDKEFFEFWKKVNTVNKDFMRSFD